MMGRKHREQASLFYEFRLDDMIPKGHLLRRINVFVTSVLGDLHEQLGPFYSDIGRPSIDPELLIRMLIIGYCFGIRSERKLCEEVRLRRLAADTAYGTGKFLGWLVKRKKIIPHIPVWEMSDRQDGIFSRSDFHWDRKRGAYICPNGKLLKTSGAVHDGRTLLYRASKRDCDVCPIRAKCCTTADARKIPRDIHEDARDIARRKMKTKAFAKSRDERKRVEMRFAHLKTHHGFERLRLRGLSGARDEFHLAAIVQNLKTLALRTLGPPTRRRASYA